MAKKLTEVQANLLIELKNHIDKNKALPYSNLKNLCGCKSFEGSFNALLFKGYVTPHKTDDNTNKFKLV